MKQLTKFIVPGRYFTESEIVRFETLFGTCYRTGTEVIIVNFYDKFDYEVYNELDKLNVHKDNILTDKTE